MKGQYRLSVESINISQTRTIIPRLYYSNNLLGKIIDVLKIEKSRLKKSNRLLLTQYEDQDPACIRAINLERTVSFSIEILYYIQKRISSVSRIDEIPKTFPSLVPMIRTISAQLIDIVPESSQHLSELSVHLGSITLDSATITTAQFDFSQSNIESSLMLDEVKLMVDSKINKQYPQLDFF
jgi:hypothetical protein